MNLTDIILWAIGIVITIALAFIAAKKINKSRTQNQKTSGRSSSIQAGRDVNINDR